LEVLGQIFGFCCDPVKSGGWKACVWGRQENTGETHERGKNRNEVGFGETRLASADEEERDEDGRKIPKREGVALRGATRNVI